MPTGSSGRGDLPMRARHPAMVGSPIGENNPLQHHPGWQPCWRCPGNPSFRFLLSFSSQLITQAPKYNVELSSRHSCGFFWLGCSVLRLRHGRHHLVCNLALAQLRETLHPLLHLPAGKVSNRRFTRRLKCQAANCDHPPLGEVADQLACLCNNPLQLCPWLHFLPFDGLPT